MTKLAFRATYADWKLIKTRGVIQVVMEVPLADADAAYNVLGGMPDASRESWFAIAPLKLGKEAMPNSEHQSERNAAQPQPESPSAGAKRERMDWRELQPAAQAGIRCEEAIFGAFLREKYPENWSETVGFLSDGEVTTESDRRAQCVRLICGVSSRSALGTNHIARMIWHQLDTEYQAWKLVSA